VSIVAGCAEQPDVADARGDPVGNYSLESCGNSRGHPAAAGLATKLGRKPYSGRRGPSLGRPRCRQGATPGMPAAGRPRECGPARSPSASCRGRSPSSRDTPSRSRCRRGHSGRRSSPPIAPSASSSTSRGCACRMSQGMPPGAGARQGGLPAVEAFVRFAVVAEASEPERLTVWPYIPRFRV